MPSKTMSCRNSLEKSSALVLAYVSPDGEEVDGLVFVEEVDPKLIVLEHSKRSVIIAF